ncbi:MAG: class I SAM-dependent methyltransferase [Solirubrobacteraceae bacterium]
MAIDRERLNLAAQRALVRVGRRLGWHVVRADYYSPIVETGRLPTAIWSTAAPMHGVELDLDAQLELIERSLARLVSEWNPPLDGPGFHLLNPFYGPLDAELLFGLVRHLKPRRVLELGSGYSSLVIDAAAERNARDGSPLEHTIVDPFPSPLVAARPVERVAAQTLELDRFTSLQAGDILFVDSTHTVKPGGEVVRLVLEVMPVLNSGVIVHFHDIFRPFEYPQVLYERFNKHWQEHYLLEAFLAFNPRFKVLAAAHALARLRFDQTRAFAPALTREMAPSGFWIEVRTPQAPQTAQAPSSR